MSTRNGPAAPLQAFQGDGLQGQDGEGVDDLPGADHGDDLVEGQPADGELLGAFGPSLALHQVGGQEDDGRLVRDRVGELVPSDLTPGPRAEAGLLEELPPGPVERILVARRAALGISQECWSKG